MSTPPEVPGSAAFLPSGNSTKPNGIGLAALIIGGVAFAGSFLPVVNYFSGLLAVVGLVLGIVAWTLKGRRKLLAVLGTIVSLLALALSITLATFYTAGFVNGIGGLFSDNDGPARQVSLVYEVTGEAGTTASITHATFTDGSPMEEQLPTATLPFYEETTVTVGGEQSFSSYTVTAVAEGASLTCTITLDGEVIEEQTSFNTCSASHLLDERE